MQMNKISKDIQVAVGAKNNFEKLVGLICLGLYMYTRFKKFPFLKTDINYETALRIIS